MQQFHPKRPFSRSPQQIKSWQKAKKRCKGTSDTVNYLVEYGYMQIIKFVKEQIAMLPEDDRVYYEQDFRQDHADPDSMYLFITPFFYWYLHCPLGFQYYVITGYTNVSQWQEIRNDITHYDRLEEKLMFRDFTKSQNRLLELISQKPPQFVHII